MYRVVLSVAQLAQQEPELGGHPRGTAGFPAGDVGELGRLRGATEGGERGVMGEDRLGGECRLDRLLRVERTEQMDGGSLVAELLLRCRWRRRGGRGSAHAGCRR
jgi:hypothetical protein